MKVNTIDLHFRSKFVISTAIARTHRMSLAAQRFSTLTIARRQLGLRLAIGRKIPLMPGIGD